MLLHFHNTVEKEAVGCMGDPAASGVRTRSRVPVLGQIVV